jgi:hypothetical protein
MGTAGSVSSPEVAQPRRIRERQERRKRRMVGRHPKRVGWKCALKNRVYCSKSAIAEQSAVFLEVL